jgi:beta-glucosidase
VKAVQKTGTPTVVVLINGRPLATEWIAEHVPAIVEAWEPGMEGGRAVADVLFGDYNPSGKLPMTIPRSVGHLPQFYNYRPSYTRTEYELTEDNTPLYRFGHGLSYTTFTYQDLEVPDTIKAWEDVHLNVSVTNDGSRAGDEVVQVYVNDVISSVTTPVKELKAFKRITLQPGETRRVELTIKSNQLALYNRDMERVVEPGTFEVMVEDLRKEFEVTGRKQPPP